MEYYGVAYTLPDGWVGVHFPDFPGIVTQGKDMDEARVMARDALNETVIAWAKEKRELPKPCGIAAAIAKTRALHQELGNEGCEPVFVIPVAAEPFDMRTVKINVSLANGQLKLINRRARELGLTRSALMVKGALAYGE